MSVDMNATIKMSTFAARRNDTLSTEGTLFNARASLSFNEVLSWNFPM